MAVEIRNRATLHTPLPPPLAGAEKKRWELVKDILHRPEFRFFLEEDMFLDVNRLNRQEARIRLSDSAAETGLALQLSLAKGEGLAELVLDDRAVRALSEGMSDLRDRGELISILSCMDLGYVASGEQAEPFTVTVSSINGKVVTESFDLGELLNMEEDGSTPFFHNRIKSGVELAVRVGRRIGPSGFEAARLADTLGQLLMLYYFIRQRSS